MTMLFDAANRITTIEQGRPSLMMPTEPDGEDANGSRTTNVYEQENRLITIRRPDAT